MKRQIAKGLAMLMVTLALAAASAAVANGQSKGRMVAQVPFDFVVNEKTLSAGEYRVGAIDQSGGTIAILNANGATLRTAHSKERGNRDTTAKLVFHRYGNTYFLREVWMAGEQSGRELSMSRQERAIERELGKIAAAHGEKRSLYEIVEVVAGAR
ncbi:MAG TPA: hypothetical protein VE863_02330 [Pyrinomonadaceae bacterium]|jgi:hypothetical protein|nr:hypothetical protein [Pyrinomonadaceae bacterium]